MKLITKRIKPLLLFLSFCCSSFLCMAQDLTEKAYRGELKRWNQFSFDSLWQFNATNDTSIANISGNNEGWQIVNTEFLQDTNGQPIKWNGIGWFRKKFDVPTEWRGKPVAVRMGHFGASEIYLNGKLVIKYGVVGNGIEKEKIYTPRKPIIIQLDSQASHTITVHYSNQHINTPNYPFKFTGFRLLFAAADTSFQAGVTAVPSLPISISILFIFTLFFLFVYFFDVKRLASLLTALMLLNFCCLIAGNYLQGTQQGWESFIRTNYFVKITASCTNCFQLFVLYALYYDGKMPRRSWILIGIMALNIFLVVSNTPVSLIFNGLINLLLLIEVNRILISGVLKKKTGFWILLIGSVIQQTGFFIFALDIFNLFPIMTRAQEILLVVFPQMGIPLTYALHLAWEFGKANKDLRLQLVQVNELSKKTLAQEQEKQDILTQQKDKLEGMVTDRTKELSQQKETLQNTLTDLKATQGQLIQSEKMASLGELTAGIAHEIQNPLNFVNNFSEVSNELLDEMKAELAIGNKEEAIIIADDVKQNLEKILHHGKRADAIVKSMLQHSHSSNAVKEPTDINKLADEYLRLAYHGLRAKDKSFNAILKTDFDETIGNINIIPQDIGRVLLNLYTNAFYAVQQKQKEATEQGLATLYEPTISVSTKKIGEKVEIKVGDNGNGIPQKIVTTKPTGQGTGLGLSLAYDIVKAHGGDIKIETKEGEGSEFIILLPVV
jgi:two-component system, NtrC family, sensor kinase